MATETESQTCFDRWTSVRDALATSEAATVLRDDVPGVAEAGVAEGFQAFPLGVYLRIALSGDGELEEAILDRLATITNPLASIAEPPIAPVSPEYEGRDVKRGSALLETPSAAQTARPLEVLFRGPSHGNPFVDVDVSVRFESGPDQVDVGGFYDGDGLYRVRFLPPNEGVWSFTTASNARSLDGISGSIDVAAGSGPGPVRVDRERARFVRDGKTITPIGTTAYAWTHQPDELQRRTLASLSKTPFTKIRMGLFPKSFLYNSNEPERFVFPRLDDGSWDLEHFDLEYFRHLERRIEDLARLGIDAELILFHAYDRWGFSSLPASVDDRYVRYAVRRLAALPTVWWSVANEYELLTAKRPDDWERIGRLIAEEDHVGHPLSIHNIVEPWDAASDWVTHCSIQRSDPSIGEQIDGWRRRWGKPVFIDEMGYEGDLDQGWGSLTAEEFVLRSWMVIMRGGHVTHGETFWSDDEVIFWAKGGDLKGDALSRLAFLQQIIAESPEGILEPLASEFDASWAGTPGRSVLIFLGRGRPLFRDVPVPAGHTARIEVIDAWNMTIDAVPGEHEGTVRVNLPARPAMAIRLTLAVKEIPDDY